VAVRFEATAVEIDVSDHGGVGSRDIAADEQPGRGLIGMRERVAVFGGEFEAQRRDGGFHIRARLPIEPAAS
jgi:signal transduction histidine kinase